jgi:hypothetical protein
MMHLPSEMVFPPPKSTVPLYDLTREQAPPEDVQRLVFAQASQNTFFPSPLLLTAVALCYGALDGFTHWCVRARFTALGAVEMLGTPPPLRPLALGFRRRGSANTRLPCSGRDAHPLPQRSSSLSLSLSLSLWLVVL